MCKTTVPRLGVDVDGGKLHLEMSFNLFLSLRRKSSAPGPARASGTMLEAIWDFLTGEAKDASDINSTVEAHESWEVSSMPMTSFDVETTGSSSSGRFLELSRDRRTMAEG